MEHINGSTPDHTYFPDMEREPLMNDEAIDAIVNTIEDTDWNDFVSVGTQVRDFYEDLITSGRLREVKEVELADGGYGEAACTGCGHRDYWSRTEHWKCCPGCGAKIMKP